MASKRAKTAYFVFADDKRVETKADLQARSVDGKVVSVAEVAKSLGNKWRELGEEGQKPYKVKAAALAAESVQLPAESQSEPQDALANKTEDTEVPGLPVTSVKRIMCLDEDVVRVSGDCVKAMAKLTELFLELFAAKAHAKAKIHKSATIKFADATQAVTSDKRLIEMGLKDMFLFDPSFEDARSEGKDAGVKKHPAVVKAPAGQAITDFFKA